MSFTARTGADSAKEVEELVLLMRRALRSVCDELRRIHKGNKLLEEQHRALAGQLAECEVKRSLSACQVQVPSLPSAEPKALPFPKMRAMPQGDDAEKAKAKASEPRLTLRLSKSLLRKLSTKSVESDESGSEIFEANNPEEVLEMQRLLNKLSSRYEAEEKLMTRESSLAEEPETSPTSRASQSRRLAPGLAEDATGPPPRRLTIFNKR